jgi:cytidylate kinase
VEAPSFGGQGMKVLTATILAWLLHKGSDAALWVSSQLFVRAIRVEDWAGIGDSEFYKVGGTSSD